MISTTLVIVLRVSVVLAFAALVVKLLRRTSAAMRHLVWTAAVAASLLVPVLSLTAPRLEIPVLPAEVVAPPVSHQPPAPVAKRGKDGPSRGAIVHDGSDGRQIPAVNDVPRPASSVSTARIAWMVWVLGAVLVLSRFALGTARMWFIARRARRVEGGPWLRLAQRLASLVGVRQRVTFLEGAEAAMPMTWGIVRPRVLLPESAGQWPMPRQRVVLLHELAHVKRRDCLTQFLAQLLCAIFWFHPLAWFAARQLQAERERACDDVVLAAGTKGSDYADHLLEIARAMRSSMLPTWSAVAMAHRSQLEGRLLAILDPRVPRRLPTRRRTATIVAALGAALVPLTVATPVPRAAEIAADHQSESLVTTAAAQTHSAATVAPPDVRSRDRSGDLELGRIAVEATRDAIPDATRDLAKEGWLTPGVAGTVRAISDAIGQAVGEAIAGGVAGGVAGGIQGGMAGGIRGGIDGGVRTSPGDRHQTAAPGESRDPRAVAALVAALKDPDDEVRESAMQALAKMRAPEALDAIRAALKDDSASVREQAGFALGQYRDRASVDGLAAVLTDPSADVREQAAFALGQIRDPRSTAAIAKALGDADASVREQAAFALGQLRSPESVDPLIGALRDQSADVREQAAFALGQLGDARAVEALTTALKDSNVEVRRMAAFALGQISK